mmetsp:Transcript_105990/g.199617  ORF Transcript_105990/g.199617 Transcript_105990/m.199617 type:complete len:265 (+) Transcript_105990:208-1002(+)
MMKPTSCRTCATWAVRCLPAVGFSAAFRDKTPRITCKAQHGKCGLDFPNRDASCTCSSRSPIDERILCSSHRRWKFIRVWNVLKVGNVLLVLHRRFVWSRDLQLLELAPIEGREPFVLKDVIRAILQVAIALAEVRCQELFHQCLRVLVKVLWEVDLSCQDLLVDAHRILITEWRLANDHLIDKDTQGPPINWLSVTLVQQNLGSNVLRRAAKRVGPCARLNDLRKPEVCELGVAILAHENVLRLQVTMNDVLAVDVCESPCNL